MWKQYFCFEILVTTYQTKRYRNPKTIWYIFTIWLQGRCTVAIDKHTLYQSEYNFENIPTCIISEYHIKWRHGRLHLTCFYFSHAGISSCGRVSVGLSAVTRFDTKFSVWSLFKFKLRGNIRIVIPGVSFLFRKQRLAKPLNQFYSFACYCMFLIKSKKLTQTQFTQAQTLVMFRYFWVIYHMRLLCNGRRSPQHVGDRL